MKNLSICSSWNKKAKYALLFAGLFFLVLFFLCLNIFIGSISVPVPEVLKILTGKKGGDTFSSIVWQIRFPRAAAAALLGGGLALSCLLYTSPSPRD